MIGIDWVLIHQLVGACYAVAALFVEHFAQQ